jgi:hypothetical protein
MRLIVILFCLLPAFSSNAQCSDLIKLRKEYMLSQYNLESCIRLNNLSKYCNPKLEPVKYSYNIISNLMQCNFILNPFSKYKIFKNSTQKLDSLILLNPKHTEIRFLRYLVQLNCPKFLLYDAHIDGDYKLIMSNIQSEPKDLQNFIYTIINQ